jgi:hypothetical protein
MIFSIPPEIRIDPNSGSRDDVVSAARDLQAQADAHRWMHTIDLGDGVVTKTSGANDPPTGGATGRSRRLGPT